MSTKPATNVVRRARRVRAIPEATAQSASPRADPMGWIGAEVRSLRKAKNLSLQELAARCGKSVGFLSQVERGLSKPTVSVLHDLATALKVHINWFFPQTEGGGNPADGGIVVRKANRRRLSFGSGISDYLLSPNLNGPLELLWSEMAPQADSGEKAYQHVGDEAGVIINGSLELWVGEQFFVLDAGDSFSFPSSTPHRYRNPGNTITEVAWVVTPPSY
ncbi:MAG: cupin domain-containing protein [Burkholderiales bacterium]|nr:cupin domain-containing protein [Burkholderiales bacterium]